MSSTSDEEYHQFLVDETAAEEQAAVSRVATIAQISSVIANAATFSANNVLRKRKADVSNTASNFTGRAPGAKTILEHTLMQFGFVHHSSNLNGLQIRDVAISLPSALMASS